MKRFPTLFSLLILCSSTLFSQNVKFAFLADTHLTEGAKSVEDLNACISDINNDNSLNFVIFAGDITEFGSDKEINLANSLIKRLNKPYYVLAGNHDATWSESGCNTFAKVFGYEHFEFEAGGVKFVGTNSGPNMRMAPALIPRESVIWLDSLVKATKPSKPIIFINHYPMDTSVLNYFEVLDILKEGNTQLIMGGHWHNDVELKYEGIPGMLGRSSQATGKKGPGYNIVSISDSLITSSQRICGIKNPITLDPWFTLPLTKAVPFKERAQMVERMSKYDENKKYPNVKPVWTLSEGSDIGAGAAISGDFIVYTNTSGEVKCVNKKDGSPVWSHSLGNKIFSTPAIEKNKVVLGCCDGGIYCYDLKSGKEIWKHHCDKSVLGSPTIYKGIVYIGSSDHRFRALNLKNGHMVWNYPQIGGFVVAKPYVDDKQVVIGDWANTLYSFDTKTGTLQWKWQTKGSRMLSPASVFPVKSGNKIFVVTPERKTYAIEATSGVTIWKEKGGRESIGMSSTLDRIFVKTMKDTILCFSALSPKAELIWAENSNIHYDIAPSPITTDGELIFIPTDKGEIVAMSQSDGSVIWRYKLSYALINYIRPLKERELLITTMDGKVTLLSY